MLLKPWTEIVRKALRRPGPDRSTEPSPPRGRPLWLASNALRALHSWVPPEAELRLYDEMRRSFPILDVAITTLVRLCGRIRVEGPAELREELEAFLQGVQVNQLQRGFHGWLEAHLDQMILYGKGIGEIVLNRSRTDVYALMNLDARTIRFRAGRDPLSLEVIQQAAGQWEPVVLDSARVLLSLHNPQGDNPHGTSLLRSLPFVAEACSIIENATAQVWQRMGAPSFHVNWVPDEGFTDPQGTLTEAVVNNLQQQFTEVMASRRVGEVRDLFTSGQVRIGIIGSEGQILAVQEPLRAFLEQMVAVTGLPPWLLGLHWSSTERLSAQQADLLISNIEALRRAVQPQIDYLIDLRQRLRGRAGRIRVAWTPVNLQDMTEQARADAWREQARQRRIENARRMWELGFWSQQRAARDADEGISEVDRVYPVPPGEPIRGPLQLAPAANGRREP
ncbi:MAG: hypothetical protein HY320_11030 [Armatimonadetes bacterium]|nr:hypothetical protein [Armatimonadota bacterium]